MILVGYSADTACVVLNCTLRSLAFALEWRKLIKTTRRVRDGVPHPRTCVAPVVLPYCELYVPA